MKFKEFIKMMPNAWANRVIIITFSAFSLLLILNIFGFYKVVEIYNEASIIEQEIIEKKLLISEYQEMTNEINQYIFRPIYQQNTDQLQEIVLKNLTKNNLNLVTMVNLTQISDIEKNKMEYELIFKGSWIDSMSFLEKFNLNDALLCMTHINMVIDDDNLIKTTMKYRIYIK